MSKNVRWTQTAGGLLYPEEVTFHAHMRERHAICDGALAIFEFPALADGSPDRSRGRLLDIGQNLIVNSGRAAIAELQRHTADGAAAAGVFDLGYLAVGTGSGGGAISPVPGDTALATEGTDPVAGPVVSGVPRPLCSVSTPPPGPPFMSNLWSAQIGSTELNGSAIDEAGIFCLDDATLYCYRTFAAQTKSAGFVMEFRWTHIF